MDKEKRIRQVADAKSNYLLSIQESSASARLISLFDDGTFKSTGTFISSKPYDCESDGKQPKLEGVITGYGLIDGRLVFAYSQDYSNLNGAMSCVAAEKIVALYDLAAKNGAPVISFLDSSGARIAEGTDILAAYGKIIKKAASLSGIITQIAVVCGPCTGAMSIVAHSADYIIVNEKKGSLYLIPPSVVKSVTGEESGSANDACLNGFAARVCKDDAECTACARELMSYLPANNIEGPVYTCECTDDLNRATSVISSISDLDTIDIESVLSDIADNGKFFEVSQSYGADIRCGFLSLAGLTIGFAASDIKVNDGYTSVEACKKTARHINYCDAFGIPFLTIVNSNGFSETSNNAGDVAKLAASYASATIPCVTLNLGKAYGSLFTVMGSKSVGCDLAFAVDFAEISVMSAEKAVNFIWHDRIDGTEQSQKTREELYEEWNTEMASPLRSAHGGNIDDVISGDDTRVVLIGSFEMLSSKSEMTPTRKRSNLPL
ncbi:MAG: hypothetical protein IJO74_05930 [Clostridia bacterium]|nr:hypothetical protein [Clostridia bacterium]